MLEENSILVLIELNQPMPNLNIKYEGHRRSPLQLYFDISYEIRQQDIGVLSNGLQTFLGGDDEIAPPVSISFWTDMGLFRYEHQVFDKISPKLSRLGINSDSHQELISYLIKEVKSYTSGISREQKQKVMGFNVEIVQSKTQYLVEEADKLESVEMQQSNPEHEEENSEPDEFVIVELNSIPQYEEENYEWDGLVDVDVDLNYISEYEDENYEADEDGTESEDENYDMLLAAVNASINLEPVRLEEEEKTICAVCLDEMVGIGSAMPCAHRFHFICIFRWLFTTNSCPLCRFGVPAEEDISFTVSDGVGGLE